MKRIILIVCLLAVACSSAWAGVEVGVTYGSFYPTDSTVKNTIGDNWPKLSIGNFSTVKNPDWHYVSDVSSYSKGGDSSATLIPMTFGVAKGFSKPNSNFMPYIALRVGPYYSSVSVPSENVSKNQFGFNANASLGVFFSEKFFAEIRYDYFGKVDSLNFDGFSFNVGMKLFDIN